MAVQVNLYTFSKKVNSTKRPATAAVTSQCNLKNACGVINPRLEFNFPMTTNPSVYNYCFIPLFDRYYHIAEWEYNDRLWIAHCNCDVLASWKDTIGASTLYVLRSSVNFDPNIIDNFYPIKASVEWKYKYHTLQNWVVAPTTSLGTYVVGVVNNDNTAKGSVTYYALTGQQMADFRAFMLQDIGSWDAIDDFAGETAKAFIDPFQYVVSCLWFPFTITGGEAAQIKFGFWTSTATGSILSNMRGTASFVLERPARAGTGLQEYKYKRPFADYYIYYEPWGIIPIDSFSIGADGVQCIVTYDYITGQAILQVEARTDGATMGISEILATKSAQVGVPMQISQISTDYLSVANNPLDTALNTLGGALAGLLSDGTSGILSAAQAGLASVRSTGSNGGIAAASLGATCVFIAKYYSATEEDNAHWGRPLCANRQISAIPGYVQVANGDIEVAATQREKEQIQSFLEGGIYYE